MADYPTQFQSIGFSFDSLTATGYRNTDGFCFTVKVDVAGKNCTLDVPCAVHSPEEAHKLNEAVQNYVSEHKRTVKSGFYDGNRLMLCYLARGLVPDVSGDTKEAFDFCMYHLRLYRAVTVCSHCGQAKKTGIYALENHLSSLCAGCFYEEQWQIARKTEEYDAKTENMPLGMVGAMAGGLLGAVLWVLFSMLGKIVVMAGVLSAVSGYFAYKKLGRKISKKGLVLSLAVSFVFLLAGMYFALGADVFRIFRDAGYDISFGQAFQWIPDYVSDNLGTVFFNNIFGLIAYIGGAVICVLQFHTENKIKNRAVRLA